MAQTTDSLASERPPSIGVVDWLPALILPLSALGLSGSVPSWALMWLLAYSIYFGLKWLTWRTWRARIPHPEWLSGAYLLAWPGMDARSFLDGSTSVAPAAVSAWLGAIFTTLLGVFLFCFGARALPAQPLLQGWTGMLGVALILHFGCFRLLALLWQSRGVNATPIMHAPLLARSVSEFWGRRWNLGFRDLAHQFVFEPARRNLELAQQVFWSSLFPD